ncbi:MAG: glycosyltransferase [Actinomycetota bacterium]|nr:glycosyltransferase [Actinomycetota bacterium]
MRIDVISEHASPLAAIGGVDSGGQNVHVAQLAQALGRRGHHVTVHTRRDSSDLPERVRTAPGVTVEHVRAGPPVPLPKDELLVHMPEFGEHLARRWVQQPPDIVHAHFWMSGLAAQRGVRSIGSTGIPVVQTFHALGVVKRRHQGAADPSPPSRLSLEHSLARDAALVIATCSDEVTELAALDVPAQRVAVVPCGVDLDRFCPHGPRASRDGRYRILSLGRLVPRKGVETTIRALTGVPSAELIIAGGGDATTEAERARLAGIAQDCEVSERVRLIGHVPRKDVPALLRSADVVVSVPWYEPFGMVPLEAMACGVPVVASAVGGHLDTVVEGRTGALVPPRDASALAQRLRELLADPGRLAAIGSAAAARARSRYGWDRIAGDTEQLYRRVLADMPNSAANQTEEDPTATPAGGRS